MPEKLMTVEQVANYHWTGAEKFLLGQLYANAVSDWTEINDEFGQRWARCRAGDGLETAAVFQQGDRWGIALYDVGATRVGYGTKEEAMAMADALHDKLVPDDVQSLGRIVLQRGGA